MKKLSYFDERIKEWTDKKYTILEVTITASMLSKHKQLRGHINKAFYKKVKENFIHYKDAVHISGLAKSRDEDIDWKKGTNKITFFFAYK